MKHTIILLVFAAAPAYFHAQSGGCTDPLANNYNPAATQNDGTCTYNPASVNVAQSWILPPAMVETSGLIFWNNRFWTHNDNSDTHLYALDTNQINGYQLYAIPGVSNKDWEELAQDDAYVYIGDFGNNANGNRTDLHILRIEKQSLLAQMPLVDTIRFSYALQTNFNPAGPNNTDFDCEALVVSSDSIYLFTKEWVGQGSSLYVLPKEPGNHVARFKAAYHVQGLVTGAAYLEDRKLVILCGYSTLLQPFLFLLYDFRERDFFSGNKRKVTVNLPLHQVEGIATANGLTCFISNERFSQSIITTVQQMHRLDLSGFLSDYLLSTAGREAPAGGATLIAYPNPALDELHVEYAGHSGPLRFEMFDIAGQIVCRGEFVEKTTLPSVGLPPGVYWIRVTGGRTPACVKVVKQ